MSGERGKRLLKRRGEFLERPFAHQYETGGLRRVHVRGLKNVEKRVLLQAAAFNLALILRSITKSGTPRGLADRNWALFRALLCLLAALDSQNDSPPISYRFGRFQGHRNFARRLRPLSDSARQNGRF